MNDYRLIYLWIERYKNVKNKGIHFTLDYDVNIDQNCIDATLNDFGRSSQQNNNPLSVLDGFSAIVGPNGSGKSNVLELLKHLVCLHRFPSGEDEASGFLIVEQQELDGSTQLCMITNSDSYTFKAGKVTKCIDFKTVKAIYYNPIDDTFKPQDIKINSDNLFRIGNDPIGNKYSNTSTTHNIKQFASFKDGLENYDIFGKVFENSHASYVLQYQEIKNRVHTLLISIGKEDNSVKCKWFDELLAKTKAILKSDTFDYNHFSFFYNLLFSVRFIEMERSNGLQLKYHTNDISLLFCLLEYSFNDEKSISRSLEEAQHFLTDIGLNSTYLSFRHYVSKTYGKLSTLSNCFKNTEIHGGCIVIPFNQPEKFEYLNHLVSGNSQESMEPNLIRGEDIFSSVSIEGLSSGELNIINFIGNLVLKLDNFNDIVPIILLDEVEHTFHPEWQRLLIHTLNKVFDAKKVKPQVVLSTHSPFLLSDILNQKTLSLGNDKSGELKTFAANIHDILNSEFFMKRSIGESAAGLIIQCTQLIEELSISGPEQGLGMKTMKARMIIDQVNDPIVKSELNSRLGMATAKSNSLRKRLYELMHGDFTEAELASELDKLR